MTGEPELAGRGPERIESRVIDRDELALTITESQAERLPDL